MTKSHKRPASPSQDEPQKNVKKPAPSPRGIPRTYDDCDEADKMLLKMREDGKPWITIKKAWEAKTGTKVAASTLPNRHERLVTNLASIDDDDQPRLLLAKREVDRAFEQVKWTRIAEVLEHRGGARYESDVLQRVYRKIMLDGDLVVPPGIQDPDFGIYSEPANSEQESKPVPKQQQRPNVDEDADDAIDRSEASESAVDGDSDTGDELDLSDPE